jgi:hypothetical protein
VECLVRRGEALRSRDELAVRRLLGILLGRVDLRLGRGYETGKLLVREELGEVRVDQDRTREHFRIVLGEVVRDLAGLGVGHQRHVMGSAQLLESCHEVTDGALDLPWAGHHVALTEAGPVVGDDGGAGGRVKLGDDVLPLRGVLAAAGVQDDGRTVALRDVEGQPVTTVVDHVELRFGSPTGPCRGRRDGRRRSRLAGG